MLALVLAATLTSLQQAAFATECVASELIYIGTDTTALRAVRLDACAGRLTSLGAVADLPKPRWAVAHPSLPLLYVAVDGGTGNGRIATFGVDRSSGGLTPLGDVDAGGAGTTYLALDAASRTLLAANFGGGSVASFGMQADGRLSEAVSTIKATGSGPHRRQASAHAHGAAVAPGGDHALVADMGADRVFVYGFDRAKHALMAEDAAAPRAWQAPAGSGPRRALFSADGRFVYVLSELSADLTVLRWDSATGRLSFVQGLALSGPDFQGVKSASEMAFSRDGRFAYVANRGENALLVYGVNRESGELTLLQRLASGGDAPWAFELDRSGKWLLLANYRSNRVSLFGVDTASGRLSDTGQSLESPAPVSVTFMN